MNREILFRGKREDNGEWAEGLPLYGNTGNEITEIQTRKTKGGKDCEGKDWYLNDDEIVPIIPKTMGQYIGKPDINDKKIFEGDIIRQLYSQYQRFDVVGVVRFNKAGQFVVDHVWTAEQNPWKKGKKQGFAITSDCEIIGNVYDNPELLEAQP